MAILHESVPCFTLVIAQSIKLFYIIVVSITLHGEICNAQPEAYRCNNVFNYTVGSAFEVNLNRVLYNLVEQGSQTGFTTSVYGQSPDQVYGRSPDKVYGLLQCRGDTTVDQCSNCSQEAKTTIGQVCPNAGGGLVWFDFCFLRYGNYSFFGQLNVVDGWYLYNTQSVSSPDVFHQALGSLFKKLLAEAISGSKLYAVDTTMDSLSRKIYGLVQCTRDISSVDCTTCLAQTINSILAYYHGRPGARGLMGSCIVRYEIYPFFSSTGLNPLSPAEAPDTSPEYPNPLAEAPTEYASRNGTNITCNHTVNYKKGSKFESNLDRVLDAVTQWPCPDGYKDNVSGQSPDRIYGQLQFKVDAIFAQVQTCFEKAKATLKRNCTNATGGTILLEVCRLRYENFNFNNFAEPPVDPAEGPTPPRMITQSKKIPIILGVVGGLLFVFFVSLSLFATWRRLKTYKDDEQVEDTLISGEDTPISEDRQIVFKMETLVVATGNFHDDNKLGEGGFGPVYKGITEDGKAIAVKKLSLNSIQGKKEFLNEVKLVAKIQHRNLVRLLGFCAGGPETLLVYEYLPNKSLDQLLFDLTDRKRLDWQTRYIIILGVARGLLYLHHDSHLRIIHRDIKAGNILLDEKLNPKIADFGLAKLFPEDESHVSTRVAGTFGYMAPEYAMQGQLSTKADVYSFGVLLLELITGRKNTDYSLSPEMQILLGWAWRSYEGGNLLQMIDTSIIETCDTEQALRCIHVGLLCTQVDSSLRPTMTTVTLMLSTDSVTLPVPVKPFFMSSSSQTSESTSSVFGSL